MNLVLGNHRFQTVTKLLLTAITVVVIALVQSSTFATNAEAASLVAKANSCDSAIAVMNKALPIVAKRRVEARGAKGKGAKKVKRAKRNLKNAQKQANQIRAKIKQYCAGTSGVTATDAKCSLTINTYAKSIDLLYTRKLAYKKLKGKSKSAKKKKRTMKTQLKKLDAQIKSQGISFAKACGNTGSGGSNGGPTGNTGGNNDTTPPGEVIINVPGGPTNDPTPTIDVTIPENGGHLECKIDGGPYQTVTSPWTLPHLEDGTHVITCRYVDGAGNPGPETTTTITIDTTAPGEVTISGPNGPTGDSTPSFNLSGAGPGETYYCSVDGGTAVETGATYTTAQLSEGTHTVTCYLVDEAGNVGPSATVTVVIDLTAPDSVTITTPTSPTNDTTPTINVGGGDGTGHYECSVDGGPFVTVTPPFTPTLSEGTHTITCRYVDGAGNPGPETTITVVIDTTAPGAPTVSGPTGPTSDNTPTIIIGGGSGVTYQCKIDGGSYVTVPAGYTTPVLSDGSHTITCRAIDEAGNPSNPTTITVVIDTTAPTALTLTGPSGATNDNTPTYTITGGGSGATYQCKVDGGAYANVTSPYTTAALSDGNHTVTCRGIDAAGNTGAETSKSITVDTVAPGAITVNGPTGATNDTTPTYTISGGGTGVTYACKIDGGSYSTVTSPYTTAALGQGAHTITCRAVDAAGNGGPATTTNVTIDSVGPTMTVTDGTPKWDGTHSFSLSADESATYKCAINGGSFNTVSANYTTPVLSNGTHSIACQATDAAGNTGATVTKSFGVFKDPSIVSKTGGFTWGWACVQSSYLNQSFGCPDVSLSLTIPANPNGLTGNYLVDINGAINDIRSVFALSTEYTMNLTVDETSVATAGKTVWLSMLGCGDVDLAASKTNLSLSAATAHTVTIRLKIDSGIDLFPSIGSSQLSVSIHH
ncbi:MAG: Ig-like domain-containing protein [Solirubrobacterales bacterium]